MFEEFKKETTKEEEEEDETTKLSRFKETMMKRLLLMMMMNKCCIIPYTWFWMIARRIPTFIGTYTSLTSVSIRMHTVIGGTSFLDYFFLYFLHLLLFLLFSFAFIETL